MSKKRKLYSAFMKGVSAFCTFICAAFTLSLVGYVFVKGIPHITWELISTEPSYLEGRVGILPDILNTIYITVTAIAITIPFGVGSAIYLTEYAKNRKLAGAIEFAAEALSGIPSIIYGLFGMLMFSNNFGTSLLSGSLTLAIMNLPTIMLSTQESLKRVPTSYREGAYGLGAGKWRVIRTLVLPNCVDGIITGCILALGRILGESAALLFTSGFSHTLNGYFDALSRPGATLTVALYVYAKEEGEFDVAFASAAILILLALLLNLSAKGLSSHFKRKRKI